MRQVQPRKVGHKIPTFVCIEDKEHTQRCVTAIRRRRLADSRVQEKDGSWR